MLADESAARGGDVSFLRSWLRLELPRRWLSLLILIVLIAMSTVTVLASIAGARRADSAIERLGARTLPATAAIYSNTPNFDWAKVRALPHVEALTTFVIDYTYSIDGLAPGQAAGFPPADNETLNSIEVPVVFAGRMFNPARADEVVVTRRFAASHHKHVGDIVTISLPTVTELAEGAGSGPAGNFTGPKLVTHIVGVVTSQWLSDEPGMDGFVEMSPGVVAAYPDNTIGPSNDPRNLYNFVSAIVRLKGGEKALPQFRLDLAAAFGRADLEIQNLAADFRDAQRHIVFESRCLLAFGLAALAAAVLLIRQAVARYAAANTTELGILRPLGLTSRQTMLAASAAPTLAAIVGAAIGVALSYVVSTWFPRGTASLLEPSPGRSADWVVFASGFVVVVALVAAAALVASRFALLRAGREPTARRSSIASALSRSGLPVPVVIGARFALEPGSGRNAVPVRPAVIGAVAGVLGILAAFTVSNGVSDAIATPERFGQTFQLIAYLGASDRDSVPTTKVVAAVAANPAVAGVDDARQAIATDAADNATFVLYSYTAGQKSIRPVLFSGRMPTGPAEVVLAPRTLRELHAHVGDRVQLRGDRGLARYVITGSGLVPNGPRNGYANGGWLTPAGYDQLFAGFKFHLLLVAVPPGADVTAAIASTAKDIARAVPEAQGFSLTVPDVPIEVAEIRTVRALPTVLGLFLALLAVGAVAHALGTAVRRRSNDLAVLRALGMTRPQARAAVATQASLLGMIGLAFGIPLGIALGRTVWRAVASDTPLQYVPPSSAAVMFALVPAALVIANVLALLPARRAVRTPVSQVLRAE
jgi:ABC-type lipoprotein release transport system permease subunit